MFSVTIPTLWKADEIYESIHQLSNCDLVKEVFIINNSLENKKLSDEALLVSDKIFILTPKQNLNISKSWNKGVMLSSYDVCLLNDDIVLNESIFQEVARLGLSNAGVVGLAEGSISDFRSNNVVISNADEEMNYNFGCCMFFKKEFYYNIPSSIVQAYNDNFIFQTVRHISGKENKRIYCNIKGRISVTMNEVRHDLVSDRDAFFNEIEKFYNEL